MGYSIYQFWEISKVENFKEKFFSGTYGLKDDAYHVTMIAKCRAYINHDEEWDPTLRLIPDPDQPNSKKMTVL